MFKRSLFPFFMKIYLTEISFSSKNKKLVIQLNPFSTWILMWKLGIPNVSLFAQVYFDCCFKCFIMPSTAHYQYLVDTWREYQGRFYSSVEFELDEERNTLRIYHWLELVVKTSIFFVSLCLLVLPPNTYTLVPYWKQLALALGIFIGGRSFQASK